MARTPSTGQAPERGRPAPPRRRLNYPRAGKGPIARWLPSWRVVLGAALTGIAVVLGVFIFAYATTDVPEPDDFAMAESTTVYFADGETPMGSFAEVDRQSVPLDTLPEHVGAAVVASEDRRFYQNNGIDPKGLARALWNNVRGLPTQGGSTLTQQYVERYYVGSTTSYAGKFKETILALKIDRSQSKEAILENYLNTIYFGRGAYGIEKAAQAYFGKPAAELTMPESALLAGIIPAPSAWDPAVDPERAEQRWERVMDLMAEDGWITAEERSAATYPQALPPNAQNELEGPNGYLLQMVREELVEDAGMTEEEIDTRGLDIVTTIDKPKQDAAVQAVANLPADRPANNRVALVSLDPSSGAIVALYGGPDYLTQSRNAATQDVAQGGSTFKPFALVAALESGVSLQTRYASYAPMEIEGYDFPVSNFDRINRGRINLVEATANSVNTVYAQLNVDVGPEKTVDVATRAGIPADTPGLVASPSNVLGPASPHPIDTATAFATFAAQGVRHDPFIVEEVRDGDGDVVYTGGAEGERVFAEDVMADATYAMQQVVRRGTGETASEIGRPAAGKTGSSNAYRSAWFSGFVPQLATTVAMYQVGEDGTEEELTGFGGVRTIAGGTYPTQVWRDYMLVATEGMPVEEFPERAGVGRVGYGSGTSDTTPRRRSTEAPAPAPAPAPTTEAPTETPTPEPTTPEPTETPTPTPTPTPEPTQPPPATPAPTPPPTTPAPPSPAPTTPAPPATTEPTQPVQPPAAPPADGAGPPAGPGG